MGIHSVERKKVVEAHTVDGDVFVENYDIYRDWITEAIKHDMRGLEHLDVIELVRSRQLFPVMFTVDDEAAGLLLCELQQCLAGRYLEIRCACGRWFELWGELAVDTVKEIAASQGARGVHFEGRPGWVKKMKQHGFVPVAQVMRLEL